MKRLISFLIGMAFLLGPAGQGVSRAPLLPKIQADTQTCPTLLACLDEEDSGDEGEVAATPLIVLCCLSFFLKPALENLLPGKGPGSLFLEPDHCLGVGSGGLPF